MQGWWLLLRTRNRDHVNLMKKLEEQDERAGKDPGWDDGCSS
jgi:hypothetical protein